MKHDTDLTEQALRAGGEIESWLPPEAPLAMPAQALTREGATRPADWLRLLFGRRTV